MEFNDRRVYRLHPVHASGGSMYPVTKADFDSPAHVELHDPADLQAAVNKKTAKRYDEDSGTFKTAKVSHYRLTKPNGEAVHIPVGHDVSEYNPMGR